LIIYMHIVNVSKYFQVGSIWLSFISCLLWSHVIQAFSKTLIWQVDSTIYSFSPKLFRHLLAFEHALAMLRILLFFLSTTLFFYGNLGTVRSLFIPLSLQKLLEKNSPLLSILNDFIE
jgi:hypothetical protein